MANSESEDFESADEEISKPHDQSIPASLLPASGDNFANKAHLQQSSTMTAREKPCHQDSDTNEEPKQSQRSVALPLNPESLGAKPKMLQKTRGKSNSKHRGSKGVLDGEAPSQGITSFSHQDSNNKRRSGSSKLGVKISPTVVPCESLPADCITVEGKSAVSWNHDASHSKTDCVDLEGSVQPLLDKLASLDVSKTSETVLDTPTDKSSGWGAWSSWGMSTIMSGASSVSSHVSQGLSTVSSVIESGLGAVDPQELAKITVEAKKLPESNDLNLQSHESNVSLEQTSSGFNVMGNVLKFVESTGEMIVTSGLNTLESIGKKTMDVLQEGDPGLKKKRALFSKEPDRPNLSQVLREARNKADVEDKERAQAKKATRAHFETLFDDFKGMIHLEALEMLSNTCQLKLEAKLLALSGTQLIEFQRKLIQIKELCEIPDDDDDGEDDDDGRGSIEILERDLATAMRGLMVPVPLTNLIKVSEDTDSWLMNTKCIQDQDTQNEDDDWADEDLAPTKRDPQTLLQEIHQQAIQALARFTAAVAEHFHKTAELLLLKDEHDSQSESQCVVLMTSVLCSRVSSVAARFSELLSASAKAFGSTQLDHNDVNSLITNVFLEASNSSSYIQDASMLLVPVLQLGAVQ